ncbi:MAG: hypothetical protein WAW39_15935 [Prosthecobacter sp.]|uniref:hypothetical protein n=1 Tax=Prosthecobacter sp. TaxID=1965333 RepID=UPI003BB1A518
MFRGDIVCLGCTERVRKVRRDLLVSFANRDIQNVLLGDELRQQILCCAIQQVPKCGRPQKGLLEA